MMKHEHSVFGLSDGGAHCALICDASMLTFLLIYWVRDQSEAKGERFSLKGIIHRQTQRTAEFYGMKDRGVIAPGMTADLTAQPKAGKPADFRPQPTAEGWYSR